MKQNTTELNDRLKLFIERYFQAVGARMTDDSGIHSVQLPSELAQEIDGYNSNLRELHFTFDEQIAKSRNDIELLTPGSFRLDKIISSAVKRGKLTRAYYRWEPNGNQLPLPVIEHFSGEVPPTEVNIERWLLPHFVYRFRLTYSGSDKHEELASVAVCLTTGAAKKVSDPELADQLSGKAPARCPALKRRLSYKKAYELAVNHLKKDLLKQDKSWAREAKENYEQERANLVEYFAAFQQENPEQEIELERKTRLSELEKRLYPRVIARPYAGISLWVQGATYAFPVGERQIKLRYNPFFADAVPARK